MSLVSIIIPCYNVESYLSETLASVFGQVHHNWQCVIIDDHSSDGTTSIIESWVNKDSRFVYYKNYRRGVSAARNTGLMHAMGEYILFLDADDKIDSNYLAAQLHLLSAAFDISVCDYWPFDHQTRRFANHRYLTPFTTGSYLDELIIGWEKKFSFPPHCVLFRKSLLFNNRKRISFNEGLPNHVDWCFWVAIFLQTKAVTCNNNVLVEYRIRDNSICSDVNLMKIGFRKACLINAFLLIRCFKFRLAGWSLMRIWASYNLYSVVFLKYLKVKGRLRRLLKL